MTKKILFQDSLLISGIMCYQGCGLVIQHSLMTALDEGKEANIFPKSARLIMDAEPQTLGIHRLFITLECDDDEFRPITNEQQTLFANHFKESIISMGFDVIDANTNVDHDQEDGTNWVNILVNVVSMITIIGLSIFLPASLPLTIGLTVASFVTTAFTARHYLINFVRNVRDLTPANMATTVSLGWLLSLAHTLYHAITMPLVSTLPMTVMSYIMPIALITLINGMDEIKRLVLSKSKKMHLHSTKTLFPQMADAFDCVQLTELEHAHLSDLLAKLTSASPLNTADESWQQIATLLDSGSIVTENKNSLTQAMIIHIKRGECFPVDCRLIQGSTVVDASLLTGENQQSKQPLDVIPAGAINMGQPVTVYALNDAYSSTVNQILFRSHRAKEENIPKTTPRFTYLYLALIVVSIIAAIVVPWALGVMTIPLLLQNITGILFAVCPCTVAIAHELPTLLSAYRRNNNGIVLRDEALSRQSAEIDTVVFDKTGTLTTGNSQVEAFEGISSSLWQRIYLLEKHYGAGHPLAKAINHYYETTFTQQHTIQDIKKVTTDTKGKGLSAFVQGRQLHIGSVDYLRQSGIDMPELDTNKIRQGFSAVYVAQDKIYQGVIYIKHETRPRMLAALSRLKREGKKIIMLTGDTLLSAQGFNQQNGGIFDDNNIHAAQTPESKEAFMKSLMANNQQSVWFVGDGLNDAPCARVVTEQGGVSCAMTSETKAAFFSDISLNGSIDYLFEHYKLNQLLKKTILLNQGLLAYGALAFLACILSFSIVGIGVSPIIPLLIMASTTLFVLFNSYRVQLAVDQSFANGVSWPKRLLASDLSIGLLVGASLLLITSLIITTVATGGLALPVIVFTAGVVSAISSSCLIAAGVLAGLFVGLMLWSACEPQEVVGIQNADENMALVDSSIQQNRLNTYGTSLFTPTNSSSKQVQRAVDSDHILGSDEMVLHYQSISASPSR